VGGRVGSLAEICPRMVPQGVIKNNLPSLRVIATIAESREKRAFDYRSGSLSGSVCRICLPQVGSRKPAPGVGECASYRSQNLGQLWGLQTGLAALWPLLNLADVRAAFKDTKRRCLNGPGWTGAQKLPVWALNRKAGRARKITKGWLVTSGEATLCLVPRQGGSSFGERTPTARCSENFQSLGRRWPSQMAGILSYVRQRLANPTASYDFVVLVHPRGRELGACQCLMVDLPAYGV